MSCRERRAEERALKDVMLVFHAILSLENIAVRTQKSRGPPVGRCATMS